MKYWVYNDGQVSGPYEINQLKELLNFSPSTFVCLEGSTGEQEGDWARAETIHELQELFQTVPQTAPPHPFSEGSIPESPPAPAEELTTDTQALLQKIETLAQTIQGVQNTPYLQSQLEEKEKALRQAMDQLHDLQERLRTAEVKLQSNESEREKIQLLQIHLEEKSRQLEALERQQENLKSTNQNLQIQLEQLTQQASQKDQELLETKKILVKVAQQI